LVDETKIQPFLAQTAQEYEAFRARVNGTAIATDGDAEEATALGRNLAQRVESIERQRVEFTAPLNAQVKLINSRFGEVSKPLAVLVVELKNRVGDYWTRKRREAAEAAEREAKRLQVEHEKAERKAVDDLCEACKRYMASFEKTGAAMPADLKEALAQNGNLMYRYGQSKVIADAMNADTKARAKADKKGVEVKESAIKVAAPVAPPPPPPAPIAAPVSKTVGVTGQVREVWDFEVVDKAQVPLHFLVVDEPRVRRAILDAAKEDNKTLEQLAGTVPGIRAFKRASVAF
jgi:hypothetical protein